MYRVASSSHPISFVSVPGSGERFEILSIVHLYNYSTSSLVPLLNMVSTAASQKNIWVAASDGDLNRVKVKLLPCIISLFPFANGLGVDRGRSISQCERFKLIYPNVSSTRCFLAIPSSGRTLYYPRAVFMCVWALTCRHAAASYAHLELLAYLISVGGDINLVDDEGETPLFTAETIEAAQWLVENGAEVGWTNTEGQTVCRLLRPLDLSHHITSQPIRPLHRLLSALMICVDLELILQAADFIEDDHPEIAQYLRSLLPSSTTISDPSTAAPVAQIDGSGPSALAIDNYAQDQASSLLQETQRIMREAEQTGENPDEKLREVVERAVREGMAWGGENGADGAADGQGTVDGLIEEVKRRRED